MEPQLITSKTVSETLLPRRYQEEIFAKALKGNVIAALDTGSGKTFISTLLIKWIATRNFGQNKIIIFLVPKVALVEQQGDFISKQTPLRVKKIHGALAIDLSDRDGWKEQLSEVDVIVMTAQIFLNIITHSHHSMDKVSLLIFDECHHTRKNHAYNGIMQEYFQCPIQQRPKIFGMTASPIWNPKDAQESLATLEKNLDSNVIAVREHTEELENFSPRPKEEVREFPPSPDIYVAYPSPTLWSRCEELPRSPELDIPWLKIEAKYRLTIGNLGPFCAEYFLYTDLKQRALQLLESATDTAVTVFGMGYFEDFRPTNPDHLPEIRQILSLVSQYDWMFGDDVNTLIDPSWCSPKVTVLVDILLAHHKKEFQGIAFVEQRHTAACLARMIPRLPKANGRLKCAELIGHNSGNPGKSLQGMPTRLQRDVVQMFRDHEVNLLIATSVAEEGLDFPSCDLVIRFDPLSHMVGYVQSRGRARHHTSSFVIMVEQGHLVQLARYKALRESEPELRRIYQARALMDLCRESKEEDENEDPQDLSQRERYIIPSTGAVLTYNTAIGLLNHLCSLIPRDSFTPVHLPTYSGDFRAIIELPSSLPLPPEFLVFAGPEKRSKKEAKRAVAFTAVKKLHDLSVFDDYLLPAKGSSGGGSRRDADGRTMLDISGVPDMMDVLVRDPWTDSGKLYLHVVCLDGMPTSGLITGSILPPVEMICNGVYLSMNQGTSVVFDGDHEWWQRRVIQDYTRMCLWWNVTFKGISSPLTSSLVPLTSLCLPDFELMERALEFPYGCHDWTGINDRHCHHLLLMNVKIHGRPLLLRKIRPDLTPTSKPPPEAREAPFPTYRDYWIDKYTRKGVKPDIPQDGPLIEAEYIPRENSSFYSLKSLTEQDDTSTSPPMTANLLPQGLCRWVLISHGIWYTSRLLPKLMRRVTDVWRSHQTKLQLHLPPIHDHLLIEALTLPSASAGFNNQRFETLGDSVLKLSTVVYLYNKFPHRHEGQLDSLRRICVSNRTLLARAKEIGLEHFITSEPQSLRVWRYTASEDVDLSDPKPLRNALRNYPRRSLQDCMEAILGASFATGGIPMALRTGTVLGLCFGGHVPWSLRYGWRVHGSPVPPLFYSLQESLGYEFKCGELLIEAVTHPSFRSGSTSSYQRLEFLGDALVDLAVMRYLYYRYPEADSGQLSAARSRAVCNPALACLAVKRLDLHKVLLVNNVELSTAIARHVPVLEQISFADIVAKGWKFDPPKALGDVFESVLGALFVDSGYNFERSSAIIEMLMEDLLPELSLDLEKDPVSGLMVWAAQQGCRRISYQKSSSGPEIKRNDSVSVLVHDVIVAGPLRAGNMSLSKGLASEQARQVLEDPASEFHLPRLCDCGKAAVIDDTPTVPNPEPLEEDLEVLDDTTEEGFAALARMQLDQSCPPETEEPMDIDVSDDDDIEDDDDDWIDEREVEAMLVDEK